ncbi:MAG: NAD(+)/NADH kinase [Candidatus Bathyarchaeota archaeon]|nr:NAD(+)/NADH kinase [Candidatus Bathyarchaeota archaeon]
MRVGVVSRTDIDAVFPITRRIIEVLEKKGVEVLVETETAMALNMNSETVDLTDIEADFVVAVGGDGTILRVAMGLKVSDTPLLGVNMGRRGFLCEVLKDEIESAIDRAVKGEYELESCLKIRSCNRELDEDYPDALNEVLIASSLPSKMILCRLLIDGEQLTEIQADGILVATPTGSTAYNLSAGGSILAPGVEAMILTAINPYSYFRSITLPIGSKVTVELRKPRADALAIVDGKVYTGLKALSTIEIEVSKNKTRFIRFKPFYERLRSRITHIQAQ